MTAVTLAASLLNIAANWFFMAVTQWGVAGSAIGTVSAQAICLVVILTFRCRRTGGLRPAGGGAAGEWRTILALGMPVSLGFIGMSLSSAAIIFNLTLWNRSDYAATIAAYGIITRIMTLPICRCLALTSLSRQYRVTTSVQASPIVLAAVCWSRWSGRSSIAHWLS